MKRARIINVIVWVAIAVALCSMVVLQWYNQGCELKSLIIACVFYTMMPATICGVIDQTIQGK